MMPFIPHYASECLNEISIDPIKDKHWPKIDLSSLKSETINIVVQINGKKRDILELKNNCSENEVINMVDKNKKLSEILKN